MFKYVGLTCVLMAMSAFVLSAQVIPGQTVQTTGMVGIGYNQTAQLNLLNPGVLPPAAGVICSATVSFVDNTGTVLKSTTLIVAPGNSQSFALSSIEPPLALAPDARREIRATIAMPAIVPVTTTTTVVSAPACKVIPTLEMLDTPSGRTLVVLGHVETIPSVATVMPE